LDAPNTAKDSDRRKCNGLDVGVTGMQGWRLEMEDAHIAEEIGSRKDHVFLAVFDGHGGAGAAIYAEHHMVGTLEKTEQWKQYLAGDAQDIALLGEALKVAFVQLDQDIKKHQEQSGGQDTSGCTSVTAVITPRYIICANAGDSRCCLGENGRAEPMSIDHKPYDDEERRRIEEAGGTVQWKRVDGDLAVSRALGDFQYKNRPDLPADKQKVSCVPEIRVWERKPTDEVLLLACDGLWDVMSNEEAIEELRAIFQSGESNAMLVAEEMIDVALEKGAFLLSPLFFRSLLHFFFLSPPLPVLSLSLSLFLSLSLSFFRLTRQHQRGGGHPPRRLLCVLRRGRGRPPGQARGKQVGAGKPGV